MTGSASLRPVVVVGLILTLLATAFLNVQGEEETDPVLSEIQCRPYIEKALKDRDIGPVEEGSVEDEGEKESDEIADNVSQEESVQYDESKNDGSQENVEESGEVFEAEKDSTEGESEKIDDEEHSEENVESKDDGNSIENIKSVETTDSAEDNNVETAETDDDETETEQGDEPSDVKSDETIEVQADDNESKSTESKEDESEQEEVKSEEVSQEIETNTAQSDADIDVEESVEENDVESKETEIENESADKTEETLEADQIDSSPEAEQFSIERTDASVEENENSKIDDKSVEEVVESAEIQDITEESETTAEEVEDIKSEEDKSSVNEADKQESKEQTKEPIDRPEESLRGKREVSEEDRGRSKEDDGGSKENDGGSKEDDGGSKIDHGGSKEDINVDETSVEEEKDSGSEEKSEETTELTPEEDLIQEIEIPENLRPRDHINQMLRLDQDNEEKEAAVVKVADIILKELKKLYDTAIQPLETLYKYRDLSNRHFGDSEIFSKPLILFMGPWSGGKSSIINYLLDIEYDTAALRTGGLQKSHEDFFKPSNATAAGAEPSPAYFNIIMHGEEKEVLDGTQLAADWTFSGLQKFGQGLLDRLRGLKLNNKLLEKINIVEIPGILEIRKQVQRLFPFNDACQWFIDRADIIFLVYDPSKLDVGPETEAILDQLKGREYQTRIILNKADQVKPEELMRVQGALIWNISPLMSSAEPPIMYSTSLWSMPYEAGAPTRLLYAQERAFLRDLRSAIDKRVEHKIASARRFAVRVRNHAKMIDCYLTTYYNHKTFFGSKKEISDKIIENPQEYHIYEGLSTLTNISRYDLPDPDVYRDFFRLNNLYEFPLLSSTCTYFRGCPINRLDVAIAYDLPELVGKYKKSVEAAIHEEGQSAS